MGISCPYLTLMREDAPQRKHSLRELVNGLRFIARAGLQWRFMHNDLPPWQAVYQQTRRWLDAHVFDAIIADLRMLIRLGEGRSPPPTAMILDSRTLQSTPGSGARASWDGAKRRKGTKVHLAVDTRGDLLAIHVTPAKEQDRDQVSEVAEAVQDATGETVTLAYVDTAYTGDATQHAAAEQEIVLAVVKLPEATCGFVLLPRRWVVERDFDWMSSVPTTGPRSGAPLRGLEGLLLTRLYEAHVEACSLPVLSVL